MPRKHGDLSAAGHRDEVVLNVHDAGGAANDLEEVIHTVRANLAMAISSLRRAVDGVTLIDEHRRVIRGHLDQSVTHAQAATRLEKAAIARGAVAR